MRFFEIGSRVSLKAEALNLSYIAGRRWYTNMYEGKQGKVIGFTANNTKLAIQFDDVVFTRPDGQISSHDNGCHGKGKKGFCWYVPAEYLDLEGFNSNTLSTNNENLLLLL
jgi:hypothetical protein